MTSEAQRQLRAEAARLRARLSEIESQVGGPVPTGHLTALERAKVLVDLAKATGRRGADLSGAIREITEAASRTLGVERASVWVYDDERTEIRCLDLFELESAEHARDFVLRAADYPAYFAALDSGRWIEAEDAHADPRTYEFSDPYLTPLGIGAMLDAPLRVEGRLVGVLCHEHVGGTRRWSVEDLHFAGALADLLSLAIETSERVRTETERRELERKVLHAQKLESLGVLAGGIAHDFNNLLMSILGNAELAQRGLTPDSEAAPLLDNIRAASQRAADLARQMLAYAGEAQLAKGACDLSSLVVEILELIEVTHAKKTRIELDLQEGLPLVDGDPSQLRQVLLNLVINAAEAIGEEEGVIQVTTRLLTLDASAGDRTWLPKTPRPGLFVVLEVTDSGCGMEEAVQSSLFDPFFTTKVSGRGLGMSVVLGIAKSHGGAIAVTSEVNRGTTFELILPAALELEPEAVSPEEEVAGWTTSGLALVVDDEPGVLEVTAAVVRNLGLQVVTAGDGRAALEVFESHADDLAVVLLDMSMPGMSGLEVLEEIRSRRPDLPVILASGYHDAALDELLASDPRVAFMAKPYSIDALARLVRETLASGPDRT